MRDLRKRYLAIARVAYENQDIASLEQLQDEAARVTPKIDDVPYFLARLHYLHNRFETATALARTAANWAPSRARNWGVVLRCAHQTDDLLMEFGAAVKVQQTAEPDDESWLSEALKRLEPLPRKALLIARETDDNLTRLKYLKIAMHSPELQEEAQDRIASTKRLLVKEMLVHEKEVEPELSLEFGRRAFPYISDMRMGLISIARLLLREGYHHEALPLWEKIVLADPDNQKWQIQLGKCRQKVGNVQKQAPVVTI